ncbi:MAG: VPS10 domain-containing protein [Terriglobales bacterium]
MPLLPRRLRLGALLVLALLTAATAKKHPVRPLTSHLLDALPFRLIGPASPAGRVWQVVGVPSQPKTLYACTADGGVWKSTNYGTTLLPILNDEAAASCGAVAIAPSNPQQVWVGTGEPASTRANSQGRGVFKSTDGGQTWHSVGLSATEEIGAVVIDPRDPNTVYVGALGHLWGKGPDRGVYKTTDGGATWKQVLFINDTTGVSDLQMDPGNPQVLYAAAWQRLRFGGGDMAESGPGSGIYKTTDGGTTWSRLTNGLPVGDAGKITLAIAHHNTQIVYAAVLTGEPQPGGGRSSERGGIFRSTDGGATWERVNASMTSYYYDRIAVDPNDDQRLWMPVFELMRSDDGGHTWVKHNMKNVHDDLHSIWIDPADSAHLVLGGDGGVNTSFDGGTAWSQQVLPIAQFYEVAVDDQRPYWVYGGMQDTGHWAGPSQTYDHEGITNDDWIKLRYNGDGMAIHPDPRDPNVLFMVQEFGNTSRLDLHSWTRTELQPPASFAKEHNLHALRWDWTPPMILSNQNLDQFFLGSNYLFRCTVGIVGPGQDPTHSCAAISPDLSAQQERNPLGTRDGYHSYGALFSLAQSPADGNVLWAGADDGPLHVTRDLNQPGGPHWTRVDGNFPPGTPPGGVISKIEPGDADPGTAFVAYDRHTLDDEHPYLFRTTDYGQTWTSMSGDLPADGPAYVIRQDLFNFHVFYAGTEFGLYVSIDSGAHWVRWKSNLPMSAVRALVSHPRDRDLIVGTFGRAIWIADAAPLQELDAALAQPAYLFAVKPAVAYNIRHTYGTTIEELNGDAFFRAANPPYGAVITYYLADPVAGDIKLEIQDAKNKRVRTLTGPGTAGLHQLAWDLEPDRATTLAAAPPPAGEAELTLSEQQRQRRVAPGKYTVTLRTGKDKLTQSIEVRAEDVSGVRSVLARK